jgi:ankyrin repeat protein
MAGLTKIVEILKLVLLKPLFLYCISTGVVFFSGSTSGYAAMNVGKFQWICARGSLQLLQAAIERGASVTGIGIDGDTPLMAAATFNRDPNVSSYLIKNGAKVNARNKEGVTALMSAASKNSNPDVISLLLEAGADINIRDKNGATFLRAARNVNPEVISILLKVGADADARDENDGMTVLMAASRNISKSDRNLETIAILIDAKASIDAMDNDGKTALFYAAEYDNLKAISALLKAGADIDARDKNNRTALITAVINHATPEIIELLLGSNRDNGKNRT